MAKDDAKALSAFDAARAEQEKLLRLLLTMLALYLCLV